MYLGSGDLKRDIYLSWEFNIELVYNHNSFNTYRISKKVKLILSNILT